MSVVTFSLLVVEDDEDDRFILDEAFKEIGYDAEVLKFPNGSRLLHYLEQLEPSYYPSLIVLDNYLPDMDATSLLDILKKHASYQSIPVVIHTTDLTSSKKDELLNKGAYACLEKPMVHKDVLQIARELKELAQKPLQ